MLELLQQFLFGSTPGVHMSWVTAALGAAGMGANILGGYLGNRAQQKGLNRAQGRLQTAYDLLDSVDIPSVQEQMLELERLVLSGKLTPQQEQAIQQRRTELENIISDPKLREAQMEVLADLDNIVQSGGLDDTALAQINQIQNTLRQQERGAREAILQSANRRGVGGSGLELAAQLENQQGSAQRASQEGFNVAAQAQQRALDSLMNKGNMASTIRQEDYAQARDKATANDLINQFNINQRSGAQQRNVDRSNQAQEFNLNRQDEQKKFNTQLSNQQQTFNKGLIRQNYLDTMEKEANKGKILTGQGELDIKKGNTQANMWSGLGSGLSSGLISYLGNK